MSNSALVAKTSPEGKLPTERLSKKVNIVLKIDIPGYSVLGLE